MGLYEQFITDFHCYPPQHSLRVRMQCTYMKGSEAMRVNTFLWEFQNSPLNIRMLRGEIEVMAIFRLPSQKTFYYSKKNVEQTM